MMLKVNDEFLDFNELVEIEKRVKLFEEIDETLGDFSYVFSLSKTSKNMRILGNPHPDIKNKTIYSNVDCDLMDDSGTVLYRGFLRVERIKTVIECSFFSGNYNWISLLSGPLSELDLSDLDTDLTEFDIVNSADNTEGVIFPVIDTGALISRSYPSLMVEDFTGCIFVKTLFERIFTQAGIKINGDLFRDPVFDSLLLSKNTRANNDIDNRSMFARKTADENFTDPTDRKILFQDDSNFPYFDGSLDLYDASTSTFTADVKMRVRVDFSLIYFCDSLVAGGKEFGVSINGSFVSMGSFEATIAVANPTFPLLTATASKFVVLEAGDTMQGFVEFDPAGSTALLTIKENSTFKVTPVFTYTTTGASLVPQWTKAQLVSNILSLFCCITDYEPMSKTLTINFMEGIKSKDAIDLSEHLTDIEEDYSEFIDSFGKKSMLSYQENSIDSIRQYNIKNFVNYGAGVIEVNNDFIQPVADILESEFKSPIAYINQTFGASLERTEFVELQEDGDQDFTGVTDASGDARFAVADATIYTVGELVRISESTNAGYNGEFVVKNVGAGFIHVRGLSYISDATGIVTKLIHIVGNDDGVYLFINTSYNLENVSRFSSQEGYYINDNHYTNVGYAFFNMLSTGSQINTEYKQGLSFGSVENPLSYQRSIVDTWWRQVSLILNDPVKLKCSGYIPKKVFLSLTALNPIRVKTVESNNLYYLNSITGYVDSHIPCEVELIKLS